MNSVTAAYCSAKFGRTDAHPRIIGAYSSNDGWEKLRHRRRLTPTLAASLQASGRPMVIVRWRLRKQEVLLSNYLGPLGE